MHLGLPRACQAGRAPVCPETSEATSRRAEAIRRLRLFAAKKNSVISLVTYSESICRQAPNTNSTRIHISIAIDTRTGDSESPRDTR